VIFTFGISSFGKKFVEPDKCSSLFCSSVGDEGKKIYPNVEKKIEEALKADGEALVSKVKGVFAFKVKDANGNDAVWIVDAKNGKGSVEYGGTGERRNFFPPFSAGGQPAANRRRDLNP
jgi:hypothetical protein